MFGKFKSSLRTVGTVLLIVGLSACAQIQAFNAKVAADAKAWWNDPKTQQGLQIGLKAAGAALVSGAETAAGDYFTTGTVHWTDVGKASASSAIRQIELTATANQPAQAAATVVQAVIASSHDPAQAEATKTAVIAGLAAAQASGADTSGALEGIAQKIDAQKTTTPTALDVSAK